MPRLTTFSTLASLASVFVLLAYGCTAGSVSGPGTGDGGTTGTGGGNGGGGSTDGGSRTIYCGSLSGTECACSTTQVSPLTADGPCTASTIGPPSLCCAIPGWPSSGNDHGLGGCVCSTVWCETNGDVCQCGFAAPSAGDTAVSSCSAGSGQICCRSKSNIAPTCACYKGTQCASKSDEQVASCTLSSLACADQTVISCR